MNFFVRAAMPPFQNEGPETRRCSNICSQKRRKPFDFEMEEYELKRAKVAPKPFQDEEAEEPESDNSEGSNRVDSEPRFQLGWQLLQSYTRATAVKRHEKEVEKEEKEKNKRIYNNPKQIAAAKAAGNYEKKADVFKRNGCDSKRLLALSCKECKCALFERF